MITTGQSTIDNRRPISLRMAIVFLFALGIALTAIDVRASDNTASAARTARPAAAASASPEAAATAALPLTPAPPTPAPAPPPPPRTADALAAAVSRLVDESGSSVGVSLVELGGSRPLAWSMNGSAVFDAASTYKLAALMMEAQGIAARTIDPNGFVYFAEDDYEDGYFSDYADGEGFTRAELAYRAAHYSDNTAGHMLVRDLGGSAAVNAWAAAAGATSSSFFDGNTTTADDLTALWRAEAAGRLGGAAAQAWLYPLLTGTLWEAGVPAGTAGATVIHKTGALDSTENDSALVVGLPNGPYVLTVMTDGLDATSGPALIAGIASAVRAFEAARTT